MIGDQLVHPGEAAEVVAVQFASLRRANSGESALGIAAEHGPVRYVGQAGGRQRSYPHRVREIAAGRSLRDDPGTAAMTMHVDRDGLAEHVERGRGILGRPGCVGRTARPDFAGQHRPGRSQRYAPDERMVGDGEAATATIHGTLPAFAIALAYVAASVCPTRSMMA